MHDRMDRLISRLGLVVCCEYRCNNGMCGIGEVRYRRNRVIEITNDDGDWLVTTPVRNVQESQGDAFVFVTKNHEYYIRPVETWPYGSYDLSYEG